MGADGRTEHAGGAEADNVIRFPRDWFGSRDDLVPIGSVADRLEQEAADAGELASALSADDFWGEGAGALHQPVDVPRVHEPPTLRASEAGDDTSERLLVSQGRRTRGRPNRLPHAVAIVLGVLVIGAALALVAAAHLGTGSDGRSAASSQAASVGKPAQVLALAGTLEKTVPQAVKHVASAPKPRLRPPARSRQVRQKRSAHHATTSHAASTEVAGRPAEAANVSVSESSSPSTDVSSSVSSSALQSSDVASTTYSAPVLAGPSTPGTAGSDCSPQCQ